MSSEVYDVCLPMQGQPDGVFVVASAHTPEGAGQVVAALLCHRAPTVVQVWVRVRVELKPVS